MCSSTDQDQRSTRKQPKYTEPLGPGARAQYFLLGISVSPAACLQSCQAEEALSCSHRVRGTGFKAARQTCPHCQHWFPKSRSNQIFHHGFLPCSGRWSLLPRIRYMICIAKLGGSRQRWAGIRDIHRMPSKATTCLRRSYVKGKRQAYGLWVSETLRFRMYRVHVTSPNSKLKT